MNIPPLTTASGRRAWAFIAIWGGAAVFTCFAAWGVWNLRDSAGLTFWLALAAHVQVLVGMTAIGWAMGRRTVIHVSRDGAKIDDSAEAAQDAVDEERGAADKFKE